MSGQVLLIEDDDALRASLAQSIDLAGMTPMAMSGYVQARRHLRANFPGVVLSDIRMPHQDGFDVLRAAQAADVDLPVILLTGHSDVPTAMRAMKEGAWDYLEKPCAVDRLVEALGRALNHRALVLKSRRIERSLERSDPAAVNFPGTSAAAEALRAGLRAVAATDRGLHLWGEDGVGRRQAAYVVNRLAPDERRLMRIDLHRSSEPPHLPEGPIDLVCRHADGASAAEIEALAAAAAAHGETRLVTLAARSIADLGWRDAFGGAEEGAGPIEIRLPNLDERREDLAENFEFQLRQTVRALNLDMPEIPETLIGEIMTRSWPGNLPELRAFATSFALGQVALSGPSAGKTLAEQVEAFEKLVIEETLRRTNGAATEAAKALGLPRNTFYDRLARYGLAAKDFRSR